MKQGTALILVFSLMLTTGLAQARDNSIDGIILGAGSGALIGQAIGRNTEATLIGGAVGTMLGYIVGNEMDKTGFERHVAYRPATRHSPQPQNVYVVPEAQRQREPICRETEMLAKINGHPERIYGTACLQNGEWVITSPGFISQTVIYKGRKKHHRKHNSHFKPRKQRKHYNDHDRRVVYRRMW